MPRASPHPLTLLSLMPLNDRAVAVLNHPNNHHLVSLIPDAQNPLNPDERAYGLNIGFHVGSKSRHTLATLGRNGADIVVEGSSISRIQCSFEIHHHTSEVMLYDRSTSQSTQTYGEFAIPFELGRTPRRVVVAKDLNDEFGFGGLGRNLFLFKIHHRKQKLNIGEQIDGRVDNPQLARTVEEIPTVLPSQHVTRIHTPSTNVLEVRYQQKERRGHGSFGEVFRAVNVDTGEIFAVKRIEWPESGLHSSAYAMLKREVETLARISHPNIVEYVSTQKRLEHLEIFMELKDGSISDLIRVDLFIKDKDSATSLFHQMLKAIDYLANEGLVHRDVKPGNILYTSIPTGGRTFQLTDFGLCNALADAQTYVGSPLFMAPEILNEPGTKQTTKVDVWSLFVTLAYAMNVDGYRGKPLHTNELKIRAAQEAANDSILHPLRDMAIIDPDQRASAGEMLDKFFNGEGRTTLVKKVFNNQSVVELRKSISPDTPITSNSPASYGLEARQRQRIKSSRVAKAGGRRRPGCIAIEYLK